jgi:hypothetical protein
MCPTPTNSYGCKAAAREQNQGKKATRNSRALFRARVSLLRYVCPLAILAVFIATLV